MSDVRSQNVFLAVPVGANGDLSVATHRAISVLPSSPHKVQCEHNGSSALTFNFNHLWASALNRAVRGEPLDAFAMLHTDIMPQGDDWLDRMLAIFERTQADVLSVIIPIKDEKGLTSTALDTSRWTPRRLTMHEVFTLPPTFDGALIREKFGAPLLLNTGLMLVRMGRSWNSEVCFTIDNKIDRVGEHFVAFFEPEDWKFSRWANAKDLKLVATREILAGHIGQTVFRNDSPWGMLSVDEINLTNSAMGQSGFMPH